MHISDVFYPESPLARATVDLLNATLIICAVIFALVASLVVICIVRFRGRPGQPEPHQFRGHKQLEIVWTVIPLLLLAFLFVLTVRAMNASDPPDKSQPPDVVVIGHQFWWEVHYPQSGVVTANEIHIPAGRRLLLQLKTADVIHDFWVPQLSRKMDTMPDRANLMWVQADQPGVYHGACSEFCGAQHAWMRIQVIADSPGQFAAWQQRQLQPVHAPDAASAQRGTQLLQQLTCVTCHAVDERTAARQAGPDLRHLADRHTLGAGVVTNTADNLARWLKNPQAVKPGNLMPNMQLSDEQVADLVTYFRSQP
ncbi:MAG TPA: cytochrome c oxidase subunit II [Bacillota bacterium]|nr:cytochrome c oxidase subunit II [Bacillota bacterium]